jgi:pimeloyl-ACP methyl ester carboxylesterase
MAAVEQAVTHVDGVRTFYRRVGGEGPPAVFLHGHPTHSEDWLPFLERIGGPALAPDLPGWGFSERPEGFDYSMHGLARFVGRFLDSLEVDECSLVLHDWGVVGLIEAQRRPARVRRLVLMNTVPLLPGYRWHWVARYLWRVPVVGELSNLTATKPALRLLSRQATPRPGPMPDEFIELALRARRPGTWPESLALYRSADPDRLEAAGEQLERIQCPALVAWGARDPYLPVDFARAYAERLPRAELLELDDAGHWPWLDRPDLIDRVDRFLCPEVR